jgi:hypothetical protein
MFTPIPARLRGPATVAQPPWATSPHRRKIAAHGIHPDATRKAHLPAGHKIMNAAAGR